MKDAVLEGGLPFSQAYGMNVVEYVGKDERFGGVFKDSMKEFNPIFMKKILETYKGFVGLKTLVDVGGGDGTILNMIISMYPAIKGFNYDLPSVVEKSPSHPGMISASCFPSDNLVYHYLLHFALLTYGGVLLSGIEHIAGDMFVRIPKGDAVFMKVRFVRIIRSLQSA